MTNAGDGGNFPSPAFASTLVPTMSRRLAPAIALIATLALLLTPALALAADADSDVIEPIPSFTKAFIPALFTLIVFTALVFLLGKYAWGPIAAGLQKREDKIRGDIEAAERARYQADASRRQYEEQMSGAEQRVRDLLAQAQADGQQVATRIRMQAQEEAEEIKERAMRDIEQSRREAVEQVRVEAATLATAVAEKILRREVNRDDQQRLINESLTEFQTVGANA